MKIGRYAFRITFRAITFAIITAIVVTLLRNPVITNQLALGQMENSNELYLLMEIYIKSKPFISVMYGCISILFAGVTIYDIYNLTKNKGEN